MSVLRRLTVYKRTGASVLHLFIQTDVPCSLRKQPDRQGAFTGFVPHFVTLTTSQRLLLGPAGRGLSRGVRRPSDFKRAMFSAAPALLSAHDPHTVCTETDDVKSLLQESSKQAKIYCFSLGDSDFFPLATSTPVRACAADAPGAC